MNTAPVAHGMDGKPAVPDWPPLTIDELRALLDRYPDCEKPLKILSTSPRPFSAASLVATRARNVFVKRHSLDVRDRASLTEEHRFIAHLHAQGAAVPRVMAAASGETAMEIGEWVYEVHEAAGGVDLYRDAQSWTPFHTPAHARSAGAALARLHLASRGYSAPPRKPCPLLVSFAIFASADPAAQMERYLAAHPSLACDAEIREHCAEALALLAPLHAELLPLLLHLAPLWTHNDAHASNFLWSDESADAQAVAIIDFGLSDCTNAVHDLAHAIERNIVEWLALVEHPDQPECVPVHLDHLYALLDGYHAVRPLTPAEAAALAPMTALCHAEFAVSEADYFLGVLHSRERARMASPAYLVGHARWFRSAAGCRLLNAIRRWADAKRVAR